MRGLQAWPGFLGRVNLALLWAAGIAMVAMVAIIAISVVMRYVLGNPLLGSNELIQLSSVILVMAALPYCTGSEGHIRVDILDRPLGRWGRLVGDLVYRVFSGFVLSLLAWRAALKALDALKWGDVTNMLKLPTWPFYAVLALGAALCVLVFATQIVTILTKRESE
jgi:TRAP-type C4-dicarboxylate transport system permease small subunit